MRTTLLHLNLSLVATVDGALLFAVVGSVIRADFSSVTEVPRPTIEKTIVQHSKPAGGPDSGNCGHKSDKTIS
jgi:hypothetical protein